MDCSLYIFQVLQSKCGIPCTVGFRRSSLGCGRGCDVVESSVLRDPDGTCHPSIYPGTAVPLYGRLVRFRHGFRASRLRRINFARRCLITSLSCGSGSGDSVHAVLFELQ
ncbi:hypothetical protein PFLUV_G00183700 [Perca fluviatilis]|uniref:Uncharacterized protein n=1 Tax=Perca fluviatilis TaxID=8168 RepID=A0A6A5EP32_PERFL|nr:hypothetical protein PFLUV_G00183700 [Perca fluviatilis]